MIRLVNDTISADELQLLSEWLATNPRLTMGEKTEEFEQKFSDWCGARYSVFVNSGSSANLLMFYALKLRHNIKKVAVPALSWGTSVAPLLQLDLYPVLVDCNMHDLSLDLDHLEEVLKRDDIDAVLSISALGLIPNMNKLEQICKAYDAILIEDNCEAIGSRAGSKRPGTWGVMGSYSFYYSHQISTIEGGMVITDDAELYNLLKMLRSHGMSRDTDKETRQALRDEWGVDDFMELFTFYVPGFNVRSTDLQAFIGIGQLERLDYISWCRHENFKVYRDIFERRGMWVPQYAWFDVVSNLAYPVIVTHDDGSAIPDERDNIVKRLRENDIETRPIIAGSIGNQPFYKKEYGEQFLPNADRVQRHGFYVPNNHNLTIPQIHAICRVITSYG